MKRIESLDNPRVKEAVQLRGRRARRKQGRFLVEGERELALALDAGLAPLHVFAERSRITPSGSTTLRLAEQRGARVIDVTPAVYAKLALRESSEGMVAVFPIPAVALDELDLPAEPLVLATIGVEKPGNVGALLRSADAFGASALVAEGGTDLWNPNVVRASLGCLFTVPVAAVPPGGLVPWLSARDLRVVAATPDADRLPRDADLSGAVALVLGAEDAGLPPEILEVAHERVRIPMRGRADSLNVSVSAAVLLYEADRQRSGRD